MKNRIGLRLVIAIVLFSSMITLVTAAIQIYFDYRVDIKRIGNYERLISESYLQSISVSVWMYDEGQILTQLNGILQFPDMEFVKIQSAEGQEWSGGSVDSKKNLGKEFKLLYNHKGKVATIGVMQTVVSLDSIYARLFNKALIILLSNGIKTFFVSGFTLLIFQYLLTRHLYTLSHWLRNLDIGKSFEKFNLQRRVGRTKVVDELDDVVLAINEMQDNLQNYVDGLVKSEQKYKILSENIPLKLFHKDLESVYVACNDNFAADFALSAEQITGKTDFELFPGELAEKYRLDDRRILESGKAETIEDKYILPGGREYVVQAVKAPLWDGGERVTGLLGAILDVTELKIAKNNLRKSEDKFSWLMESLHETHFFYSHDTEGHFTYLSPSLVDFLGYSEDEFLKHYTEYLTDNEVNVAAVQHTELSIKGIRQPSYEVEILHKNGSIRQLQISETPVLDATGKVIAVEGLAHDITERKRIESRLRQAQKMEAIGTLAGGIAHDFNNILGAILGYAELAREDSSAGSSVARDLDQVLSASNRAKDLVAQILAFSRQADTKCIALQPSRIIKESIKMLRPSLPATIEIVQDIEPTAAIIIADPTELNQIVINLCTNAFHAMEDTGGRLDISLKETDLSSTDLKNQPGVAIGTYVQLSICDSGLGIAPEIKDKIFDPYFTTKEIGKGTGMGLAIVHGIVKSYGGFISLYSEPGEGTALHVFLPAVKKEATPDSQTAEQTFFGNERVLFVDDEKMLADLCTDMLKRLGYHVTVRNSSLGAWALFKQQPDDFDIVITDQTMPGMTGGELAEKIMQIRPDMPIILCTGYSSQINESQAIGMGIKAFALKPLVKKDIALLIRKVLDAS